MTIKEKYKNAVELLKNIHLSKSTTVRDPNHVEISNRTLRENGLSSDDFWEIICPRLEKEEILLWFPKQEELYFSDESRKNYFFENYAIGGRTGFIDGSKYREITELNSEGKRLISDEDGFYTFVLNRGKLEKIANSESKEAQLPNTFEPARNFPVTPEPPTPFSVVQDHQRELQRAEFKQQRILSSEVDKRIHVIDTITEHLESRGQNNNVSIDYFHFNYGDRMDESKIFENFLSKLVEFGAIEKFGRGNYTRGTRFSFINVNIDKLREYKDKRLNTSELTNRVTIPSFTDTIFEYDPQSGDGKNGDHSFRLTDNTLYRKLFDATFEIKGIKLSRKKVMSILDLDKPKNSIDGAKLLIAISGDKTKRKQTSHETLITSKINEVVKQIRKKTKLTPKEFINNGGNVILKC